MPSNLSYESALQDLSRSYGPAATIREGVQAEDPSWFSVKDVALAIPRGVVGAVQDAYGLVDTLAFDALPDWEENPLGRSTTIAGGIVEGLSNFAAGFIPVAGVLGKVGKVGKIVNLTTTAERAANIAGKAKAAKLIGLGRAATAGAITDFIVWDGHEERLSNLIQAYPSIANPVTEFLAANPDDPQLFGRLKASLEGVGVGALVDTVAMGVKAVAVARRARAAGATAKEVDAAVEKAVPHKDITEAFDRAHGVAAPVEAKEVADVVRANPDGFTYDPRLKRLKESSEYTDTEYVVSRKGAETIFEGVDEAAIEKWVRDHSRGLKADEYIGGWAEKTGKGAEAVPTGRYFLDVSKTVEGREAALAIARRSDQFSIYHPKTGEVIPTGVVRPKEGDEAIAFSHWGDVPSGVTDPTKIGTGVAGADQGLSQAAGLAYTSAVEKGAAYTEPAVQARTPYEGALEKGRVFDTTAPGALTEGVGKNLWDEAGERAKASTVNANATPQQLQMVEFQKILKESGYQAVKFPNGQLRILEPVAVNKVGEAATENASRVVQRTRLLRDLGITDETSRDIEKKAAAKLVAHQQFKGHTVLPPEFMSIDVNPRDLSGADRLTLGLDPKDLNLANYHGPEGGLSLIRTVEELYRTEMLEDVPSLKRRSLTEMEELALKQAADLAQAPDEATFRAQLLRGLDEDVRTARELTIRAQSRRMSMLAVGERNHQHEIATARALAGEGGNADIMLLQSLENHQFLAEVVAGVRGLGAEQGRGLRAHGITVDYDRFPVGLQSLEKRPEDVARLLDEAGGRDALVKQLKERITAYGEGGVDGVAGLTKLATAPLGKRAFGWTIEYWMNAILSGPKTAVVNILGPTINSIYRPLEIMLGAGIQKGLRTVQGDLAGAAMQSQVMRKASRQIIELAHSIPEAWTATKKMGLGGDNVLDPRSSVVDAASRRHAITSRSAGLAPDSIAGQSVDWMGKLVRVPTSILGSSDEFIKQVNYRANARAALFEEALEKGVPVSEAADYVVRRMDQLIFDGQAYSTNQVYRRGLADAKAAGIQGADAIKEHVSEFVKKWNADPEHLNLSSLSDVALTHARDVTFTTPAEPGTFSSGLQKLVASHPYLRLVIPFINTPMNILRFTGQRLDAVNAVRGITAIQFPGYARSLKDARSRLIRDILSNDPARLADATGRFAAGASIAAFVLSKASDGTVTGRGPSDPEERRVLMDSGWQPYSVRVGNGYLSYARLDPLATLVGTMADIMDYSRFANIEDQEKLETLGNGVLVAVANNFTNKSYLTGVSNFVEALQSPDRFMPTYLQRSLSSFVPNVAGQAVLPAGDDNMRDVRGILDAFVAKTPGLSSTLPPQRNILGEPVRRTAAAGTEALGRWVDWFNPVAYREVTDDVVHKELAALGHAFTPPKREVNGLDLSDAILPSGQTAYDRWGELHGTVRVAGRDLKTALRREIASGDYQRLSPLSTGELETPRVARVNSIIREYRAAAYEQLSRELPALRAHDTQFFRNKRALKLGIDNRIIPQQ